jgi:hypothetical protein
MAKTLSHLAKRMVAEQLGQGKHFLALEYLASRYSDATLTRIVDDLYRFTIGPKSFTVLKSRDLQPLYEPTGHHGRSISIEEFWEMIEEELDG